MGNGEGELEEVVQACDVGFEGGETELEINGPGAVDYKGNLGGEGGEGWLVEAEVRVTEIAGQGRKSGKILGE